MAASGLAVFRITRKVPKVAKQVATRSENFPKGGSKVAYPSFHLPKRCLHSLPSCPNGAKVAKVVCVPSCPKVANPLSQLPKRFLTRLGRCAGIQVFVQVFVAISASGGAGGAVCRRQTAVADKGRSGTAFKPVEESSAVEAIVSLNRETTVSQ